MYNYYDDYAECFSQPCLCTIILTSIDPGPYGAGLVVLTGGSLLKLAYMDKDGGKKIYVCLSKLSQLSVLSCVGTEKPVSGLLFVSTDAH